MNIHVQVFIWPYIFNFLGYIPKSGIAGCSGNSMLNFSVELSNYFPKRLHQFTFPAAMSISIAPYSHPHLLLSIFLYYSHPSGILLCLWFVFPLGLIMVNIFSCWSFVYLFCRDVFSTPLSIKKYGCLLLFVFLLLICKSSLCILYVYVIYVFLSDYNIAHKYSFPLCGLYFHFLGSVFWNTELSNFIVQFIYFFFCFTFYFILFYFINIFIGV